MKKQKQKPGVKLLGQQRRKSYSFCEEPERMAKLDAYIRQCGFVSRSQWFSDLVKKMVG